MIPKGGALVRSSLFLTGSAVVQAVAGFAAQLVLMRLLFPAAFGEFATVLAGCSLVQVVLSLRINVLIIRTPDAAMTPALRDRFHAALVWETLAAVVVTLAWQAEAGLLSPLAAVLVLSLALGQWTNQALAFYERSFPYRDIAVVEAGAQLFGHAAAVLLVLAGAGAAALYLRELLINLIRLALFLRRGAVEFRRVRWLTTAEWRAMIHDARDIWMDGVLESGFSRLVVLASGAVGGMAGAGLFSQAQRLALVPHQVLAPTAVRLAANLFARTDDRKHRWRLLMRLSLAMAVGLSVAAAAAIAFADPVVPWLFGAHWRPAAKVLAGLAGLIVCFSLFDLLRAYCMAQHQTGILVAARLAQYPLLGAAFVAAGSAAEPVFTLAMGFSAVYAVSTAIVAAGLVRAHAAAARRPSPEARPPG